MASSNSSNMSGIRPPWWELEGEAHDDMVATADELRGIDERRRRKAAVLDELYENRALDSMLDGPVGQALSRTGMHRTIFNFARRAVDFVQVKVAADVPAVRAAGHGADSSQRRRARLLTKFLAGASHELRMPSFVRKAAHGALRRGTGITYVRELDGRIVLEDVNCRDVVLDPDDARCGRPRVTYHVPLVDRRSLIARFPDSREAIENAAAEYDDVRGLSSLVHESFDSDCVRLYEAWVVPMGGDPGRHVAAISGHGLLDEEWSDRCPIALMPMTDPAYGTWGIGLLEVLDGPQFEIDDQLRRILEGLQENSLRIIVDDPEASIEALSDLTIGTIVRTSAGSRPQWIAPDTVNPQSISMLSQLISWLYQVAGMDEGAASTQRPAGLNSGRALQFYHDFQSLNYSDLTLRVADHSREVSERIIEAARRLDSASQDPERDDDGPTDRTPGWTVRYARGSETRRISWSEVDMDRDAFVIELEESSAFPDSLAGRMQQVEQDAAENRLGGDTLAQLRLDPDLEARWDRQTAAADYVDWLVERLLDPGLPMPRHMEETGQAVRESIIDALRAEAMRAEVAGEDPEVLDRLERYLAEEVAVMTPPATSASMPGPIDPQQQMQQQPTGQQMPA